MKHGSTKFLQSVIVMIGIGALAFMLWEPHIEGRNVDATLFEIYFKDPFLAYAYMASTPFFIALFQAFRLLGYAGKNKAFSYEGIRALRILKVCAVTIIGLVVAGEIYILYSESDDRSGGIFMGIVIASGALVTAAFASVFKRILQDGMEIQAENEKLLKMSHQRKGSSLTHDRENDRSAGQIS